MKSFLFFFLGVIFTMVSFGLLYQYYLLPRGILPIIISSPDTNKPTSIIDTCSTQRIYGNGYSFCLPENHTLEREETPNVSQKIILTSTITWDTITIDHNFLSTSYTDSDNKFGDVNVVYNAEKKIWEATGGCDTPKKCNSSFYNKQGIHVFVGRSRWLTYIVPFDNGGIVVLNSSGGGFVKPLEELIQTLRKEKI